MRPTRCTSTTCAWRCWWACWCCCDALVGPRFGRVLHGAAENERRMRALGFPVYRYRLAAFTIAGATGGLAGALLANQDTFVSPELLSWQHSGEMLVMVILGGIGTLYGAVAGALAFVLLEDVLAAWTEHWMIILGPILIGVVLFARGGLCGALFRPRDPETPGDDG
ncbi:MAG: branched-chain amino acid ABC transporter permease [Halofilum sp. (in: g-proteobacteria)]|nr:branched-chain amino acid ABC transporter permease [Halofilum sp. (in: g-proteobacteria)]